MTEQFEQLKIIPVVKLDRVQDAVPLADALVQAGLPCAEVTFRTEAAADAIRTMRAAHPGMLLGAGTVLTTAQADEAMDAGAAFLVSPGLNPRVAEHCLKRGYPILPGVCTPTEVEAALALGLDRLKFFPAQAAGGVAMIKALSAPYTMVRFLPTGGVGPDNLREYLACPSVFACGGSWMVADRLIRDGKFDEIRKLSAQAVAIAREA